MALELKFEKTDDGRYDVASVAFPETTYFVAKDAASKKYMVTLNDGSELENGLSLAEAKKFIRERELENLPDDHEANTGEEKQQTASGEKLPWTVILESGEEVQFKSAGERQ